MAYAGLILEIFTYSSNLELPFKALVSSQIPFKYLAHICCFPSGWRENALKLNQPKATQLTSSFCPYLQGGKDGQGHLHLSVHVEPLDNPKSTALPD